MVAGQSIKCRTFAIVSTTSIPNSAPDLPQEHDGPSYQGGPVWTPITPIQGSLFHADAQIREAIRIRTGPCLNRLVQSRPNNLRAASSDDAGFWPVTSFPSVTTKDAQSAPFS